MKLTHVRLLVDDFERAVSFYRDVIGFEVTIDASEILYAELSAGDAVLAVYDRAMMAKVVGGSAVQGRGGAVITFDDPAVDETYARLVNAGARSVREPHDQPTWGLRIAVVSDPEDNLIEINHPLPQGDPGEQRL